MQINPYLHFNGNCEEAMNFYALTFGGKIQNMMLYGSSPAGDHTPPDYHGKVLHSTLIVGTSVIMGADSPPNRHEKPQGIALSIGIENFDEARRLFDALAEKGSINMAFQETFWAKGFGMLVDRYGVSWMINCESKTAV